jgi:hypothetical protein
MRNFFITVALASAFGLGISAASAQQDEPAEQPQEAAEQEAEETTSEAEPRSDEEAFADHLRSFLARVEERKLRHAETTPEVAPPSGFRYGPGW